MIGFTQKNLKLQRITSTKVKLLEPLVFCFDKDLTITVPTGFETDYASIPRLFRFFFSPTEKGVWRAAILHDWLYANAPVSRRFADSIFVYAMKSDGAGFLKRNLIWLAVRLFGWLFFNKNEQ